MKRLLLLLVLALCVAAPPARAQLHVTVRVSPVADLVHQLDCITGTIQHCGTADYRALWRERWLKTGADTALALEWGAIRRRYAVSQELDTSSSDAVGRLMRHVSLGERWRLAGLQARGWDDYHERLALLLLPRDRARAIAILAHFRPRWEPWWDAEAKGRLVSGRDSITAMLARPDMRALMGAARRFYGATDAASDSLTLTLVARPGLAGGRGTSAQVVEGASIQELLPGANLAGEVGVTLHEVAHLLLSLAPDSVRAAIATELGRAGVEGRATRSILDEALATAFGNGLVERALRPATQWAARRDRPLSFYNDSLVDLAGKALMPTLDSLLRAGATLRDPRTLAAIRATLAGGMGPRLTSPRALLWDVWGFVDGDMADPMGAVRAIQRSVGGGMFSLSVDSAGAMPREPLLRDPFAGAVVIARPEALPTLAARGALDPSEVASIHQAAAAGPVLWGARRANGARTWLIVARSAAEAEPLVKRMAALDRDVAGIVR